MSIDVPNLTAVFLKKFPQPPSTSRQDPPPAKRLQLIEGSDDG